MRKQVKQFIAAALAHEGRRLRRFLRLRQDHLVEQLIPALKLRGLRVSVVKHAHHNFDIDHPGKDTWRHREAGAFEVVVASDRRLALMREFEQPAQLSVHHLIAELYDGVDWVLVEGFKHSNLLKIEVWRAAPASRRAIPTTTSSSPSPPTGRTRCPSHPAAGAGPQRRRGRGAVAGRQCDRFDYKAPELLRVNAPGSRLPSTRRWPSLLAKCATAAGRERVHLRRRRPRAGRGPGVRAAGAAAGQQFDGRLRGARGRDRRRRRAVLPVSQRIPAGAAPQPLQPGTAARIFTGAPVPEGADAIVMQEDTEPAGAMGRVRILRVPAAGQWIRRSGEDITRGSTVLARGERLGPAALGLAASIGRDRLQVARRPRVALFSTGDELVMPGRWRPRR
jgi:molybdopterin-guanine dinucleotide biosynthesis protein MobB